MRLTGKTSLALTATMIMVATLASSVSAEVITSVTSPTVEDPRSVGVLGLGDELFWDGQVVADSLGVPTQLDSCVSVTTECFEYILDVTGSGGRLRVGIDDPSVTEVFEFNLYDPEGNLAGWAGASWSAEVLVPDASVGTWRVLVMATLAEDAPFRMRAKLEVAPEEHKGRPRDLLPNLRLTPPFEFTFEAPATLLGPGTSVEHVHPASCTASETAENGQRCLRFSLGPQNVGEGPLELHYQPGDPSSSVPITQTIYRTDGSTWQRQAGAAQYHLQHAHYHHVGFGSLELYRVVDEKKGTLEPAGTGPKQGYCIAQYMIVDWFSFDQDPATHHSTCESRNDSPTEEAVMYLTKGWSDIYGWTLDYNYVEFGANPDGLYVVRSTTDPDNQVLETDERDNSGYALIRVAGNEIEVLERGYGLSPWDPHSRIADDGILYLNADTSYVPFTDVR